MEATIYNTKGKEAGKLALNEKVWGLSWNADLVHQVVESMRSNARTSSAQVKDRSAVSGGGKKPWAQKGTGRARHGSSRSPIWRHGGVTHGPMNEKDYSKKINKKVRAKALYTVLSEKMRNGEVLFVDNIRMEAPKTAEAKGILSALAGVKGFEKILTKKKNAAYFATSEKSDAVSKSFSNFGNIDFDAVENMNPVDLLNHKYVVIVSPEKAISFIEGKLAVAKEANAK
ncbi:MAG: 50S ribosomal protein L4 [Parcubacteria group bacterium GW2011_GWC1_42_11]|uniref:Large ribosomal subunit protein uL4 n=1 Tax=Candidatus Nomurabacteria bacterium GW2011_GWC2_42_20 TaxID=1618756 RepID=A0A0G1BPI6_9BACT|nr:MAG: 50S ribosomal protein L4 [Parcubacteria group bacterium GW2011_GWC1_42_11]KKS48176.1 MAG: 50S ribosomal protein L4 [Candidatus Nomurabacteria bacterium GW2011_GWC2_42_20]KKT08504.1 MAG: 50S ribosomal protein L4 [Candidatus Nomurabacteria bacterium GW2011_GWB1_43_20]TAN37131.1 MAG: 50S ribosomal protein L4 [Patescibacteria group bacterium]HBH71523.1 50S ribosomal protein L4 [Candidatus Yonathbacteria bacterium]